MCLQTAQGFIQVSAPHNDQISVLYLLRNLPDHFSRIAFHQMNRSLHSSRRDLIVERASHLPGALVDCFIARGTVSRQGPQHTQLPMKEFCKL